MPAKCSVGYLSTGWRKDYKSVSQGSGSRFCISIRSLKQRRIDAFPAVYFTSGNTSAADA